MNYLVQYLWVCGIACIDVLWVWGGGCSEISISISAVEPHVTCRQLSMLVPGMLVPGVLVPGMLVPGC